LAIYLLEPYIEIWKKIHTRISCPLRWGSALAPRDTDTHIHSAQLQNWQIKAVEEATAAEQTFACLLKHPFLPIVGSLYLNPV
jgi:hypothetical protein